MQISQRRQYLNYMMPAAQEFHGATGHFVQELDRGLGSKTDILLPLPSSADIFLVI